MFARLNPIANASAPPFILTQYAGAGIGNWATTRYFKGPNGSGPDPGAARNKTLVIGWFQAAGVSSGDSCLYGVGSTVAGNLKGIWVNDGAGGHPYLFTPGGTASFNLSTSNNYSRNGMNTLAIGFMPDNTVRASCNGGAVVASAALTIIPVAGDLACEHTIGLTPGGHTYPCRGRVMFIVWLDRAPTDAELVRWSNQSNLDERWVTPPEVAAAGAQLLCETVVYRDWNGTDMTMVSGAGTARTTFTRTGAPTRYELERERIFTEQQWMWNDNADYVAKTVGTTNFHNTSCGAELIFVTDATQVGIDVIDTYASISALHELGVYDGTALSNVFITDRGRSMCQQAQVAAGSKTLKLWSTFETKGGFGFWMMRVRLPMSAAWNITRPAAVNRLLLGYGDSIYVGDTATHPATESITAQLRYTGGGFPGAVQGEAWGVRSLSDDALLLANRIAFAAKIAGIFNGRPATIPMWYLLGPTNDFGLDKCSAATFESIGGDLLDRTKTQVPALIVYWMTPLWRGNQATPNAFGNILEDYRQAIRNIAATRPYVTVIEGENAVTHPGNFAADQLHLRTAGETELYVATRAGIGY